MNLKSCIQLCTSLMLLTLIVFIASCSNPSNDPVSNTAIDSALGQENPVFDSGPDTAQPVIFYFEDLGFTLGFDSVFTGKSGYYQHPVNDSINFTIEGDHQSMLGQKMTLTYLYEEPKWVVKSIEESRVTTLMINYHNYSEDAEVCNYKFPGKQSIQSKYSVLKRLSPEKFSPFNFGYEESDLKNWNLEEIKKVVKANCSSNYAESILNAKSLTDHPFAPGVTEVILKVNLIPSPYADLPKSTATNKTVYLHFDIIWGD